MSRVRFVPFAAGEFERYQEGSISSYAAENVRAGSYPAEGAMDRARAEFASLLPQGSSTPGHTFVWLVEAEKGERVGHLWYYLPPTESRMFIYDIEILPAFRRHGWAVAALTQLEVVGRTVGATSLALHVFGHNPGAIALYEKLGFVTTNRRMSKAL